MTQPHDLATETDRRPAGSFDLASQLLVNQAIALTGPGEGGSRLLTVAQGAPGGQEKSTVPAVQAGATGGDTGMTIHRGVHDPTGQKQARQDAQGLRHTPNDKFVAQIEHDCEVGPHLEWSIAIGTIVSKSLAKGWILGKAGETLGPGARAGGIGLGVAIGTVTGVYTAYETADLLENSCRAHAYEERLSQTQGGTQTIPEIGLDPLTHNYDIERGFPGVRTVVDYSSDHISSLFGKTPTDFRAVNLDRALAHSNLSDSAYVAWAHKASAVPMAYQVKHGLTFASLGAAGGVFAAQKLHLGLQGSLLAASGGALIGVGLSYLGVAAKEDTSLADLLKARLMSRPHDMPRP